MKNVSILSIVLLSFLVIDTANAAVVRRSAVVVQGPAGGTVVGASRTAIVRPGFGFVSNRDAVEKAGSAAVLVKAAGEKACEPNLKALRTSH
jgi:2-phospho-L-lactate guanylyltransferase (CobY/MobA/RfbA family)